MLGFRYVCQHHQQLFAEAVKRHGDLDNEAMEEVRLRLLAWLCDTYPAVVLDHYDRKSCIGCGLNAARIDLAPMYQAIRDAVFETERKRQS